CCSAYSGHGAIGTPNHRLSSTEFQPPCVTKPPTAAWASISFCGAFVGHTRPLPLVLSRNPSGSSSERFASDGCRSPGAGGPRSTQRKRWPLRSRPCAISCACGAAENPWLPKQRSTTEAAGCVSSHRTHSCGCSTVGARTPGVHRPSAMAASTLCSSSAAVLTMMPSASAKRLPWYMNHVEDGGTGGSPGTSTAPSISSNWTVTSSWSDGRRRKNASIPALAVNSAVQKKSITTAATGEARLEIAALTWGACSCTSLEMNSSMP
ncbi:hypothetical protein ACJX0J_032178, partial [Zea mays]